MLRTVFIRYTLFVILAISISACSSINRMRAQEPEIVAICRVELTENKSETGNAENKTPQIEAKITHIEAKDIHIETQIPEAKDQISKTEAQLDTVQNKPPYDNSSMILQKDAQSQSVSSPAATERELSNQKDTQESVNDISSFKFLSTYSKKLGIPLDGSENKNLILAADKWLGTPYRMGGCSKSGIDCSCLVRSIYKMVYNIDLPHSSQRIVTNEVRSVKKEDLKEGDIVFFKTRGDRVSHVGIYLKDNKFIHASRQKGVMINDLNHQYYEKNYISAGRVQEKNKGKGKIFEIALKEQPRKGNKPASGTNRIILKDMYLIYDNS